MKGFIAQHVSNVMKVGALVHQPAFGYHPTSDEQHQYTSTHRNRTIDLHTVAGS